MSEECSMSGRRGVAATLKACFIIIAVLGASIQAAGLSGSVMDGSGRPVAGALVKLSRADGRFTFMLTSEAGGHYSTPNLPSGRYSVQGFGDRFQSTPSDPVELNGREANLDLVMTHPREIHLPPKTDFTEAEYAALMPQGEGKELLLSKCTVCHSAGNFVSRRKTPNDWKDTVVKMRYRWDQNPAMVEKILAATGRKISTITDQDIDEMAGYLAANFGMEQPPLVPPLHQDYHLPRALLTGVQGRFVVMEMDLGNAQVGSYDIDQQGIIWVSEKTSGILGRLDPETLTYQRVHTPPVNVTEEFFGGVAVDPHGKIWFSSNVVPAAQWFQYDPLAAKIINTYDVPLPTRPGGDIYFNSFAFPDNGTVWSVVTAFHRVYKLDPRTREISEFSMREGQHPFGMTIAGDGNIWYAGDNDDMLVKIDMATEELIPYKLNPNTGPRRLATDQDGNIWAASIDRNALVKLDYRTGKVTEFVPPSADTLHDKKLEKILQGVDVDKSRNLIWFSEYEAIRLGRFDPATGSFLEFPLITAESQPWIVQVDPLNKNRVWWNSRNGRIGYLELRE